MLLAEILEQIHQDKKTGLLNVSVLQSQRFPLRIYVREGEVIRFTFGPLAGVECFEYLEYYDLGDVNYLDGMAAPLGSDERLPTEAIIVSLRELGKTVQIKLWFEKGAVRHDAIA
jgi:hypothetical protein